MVEADAETAVHAITGGGGSKSEALPVPRQITELVREYFPDDFETALAVFKAESGLNPESESWCDITADGHPFSIGLAQINLTVSEIDGVACNLAFSGVNKSAVVVDENLYLKCVELAKNPEKNLEVARDKYNNYGFLPWGAFTSGEYRKHL